MKKPTFCQNDKKHIQKQGSIALISLLIIAGFTLLIVIGISDANISTGYETLNTTSQKISDYAAEACLEEAMIQLETHENFISGSLTLENDSICSIIISGTNPKTINIEVRYDNYAQHFQGEASMEQIGQAKNVKLLNWKEI
ncbi:hypothetical protein HYV57_01545 [Candidatus Peregrinibacteria bacterium]|nr:hypothetical protein [Candidatus Peregrinibacteria bacterium]